MWLVELIDKLKTLWRVVLSNSSKNEWPIHSKFLMVTYRLQMWVVWGAILQSWKRARTQTPVSHLAANHKWPIIRRHFLTSLIKTRRTVSLSMASLCNSFWKMKLWRSFSWLFAVFAPWSLARQSHRIKSETWRLQSDNSVFRASKATS